MSLSGTSRSAVIYAIQNVVNGNEYIGSASNLERRVRRHFKALREGRHHSPHLQAAFDRYGESAFQVEVLETVPEGSRWRWEQYYINACCPVYNCKNVIIALEPTLRHRTSLSDALTGRKLSSQHKANIGKALAGRPTWAKGKKLTEDHKAALKAGWAKRKERLQCQPE